MNTRQFSVIQRTHPHGVFGAYEYAFEQFERLPDVQEVITYGSGTHEYVFLVDDRRRRAVWTKIVMRGGKYFFVYLFLCFFSFFIFMYFKLFLVLFFSCRRGATYEHDFNRRAATISVGVRAIRAFFGLYKRRGYTVAMSIGIFLVNF